MPPPHSLLASLEYAHERDQHATTASATSISTLLTTTATHLQIRSEVSSALTDLLTDVEASASLSRHLAATSHTAALQNQLAATRRALAESRAVAAAEVERRQQLGDAFWVQLAKLTVYLGELEGWKEDNRGRVEEYDGMRRRLDEMTDRARALEMALEEGQQAEQAAVQAHKASAEEVGVQIDLASEEPGGTRDSDESASVLDSAGNGPTEQTAVAPPAVDVEVADGTDTLVDAVADGTAASSTKDTSTAAAAVKEAATTKDAVPADSTPEAAPPAAVAVDDSAADAATAADESKASNAGPEKEDNTTATAPSPTKKKEKTKAEKTTTTKVLQPPVPMEITDPVLECVPERALMSIFANLEAQDIMSTAQVSVIMYSRVDILFGLGGHGGGGGGGSTSASAGSVVGEELPVAAAATGGDTSTAAAAASSAASALSSTLAGGLFSSPFGRAAKPAAAAAAATAAPPADAKTTAIASVPSTTSKDGKLTGGAGTVESTSAAIDPSPEITQSTTGLTASTTGIATGRGIGRGGQMLTPELANSMAEKLSRDELAVIISMQKAQRASESDLTKLRNERDDLIAELKGVDSVKDFLVAKLRDVERAQRMVESEKETVARQVVSDQEVIAFLDYRVQELEGGAEIADRAKSRAEQDLHAAQAKATERVRVLSDHLRFERDQLAASEKEWKATKKVLVKEVKQCRAQIVSLEAERDGLREQNSRLREALLSGVKSK